MIKAEKLTVNVMHSSVLKLAINTGMNIMEDQDLISERCSAMLHCRDGVGAQGYGTNTIDIDKEEADDEGNRVMELEQLLDTTLTALKKVLYSCPIT